MTTRIIALIVKFTLMGLISHSAMAIEVSATESHLNLGPQLEFLFDQDPGLTIQSVQLQPDSNWFMPQQQLPSFGFLQQPVWARFTLSNQTDRPLNLLLEIAFPPLDDVQFYQIQSGTLVRHITVGDSQPFSARPFDHRNYLLPIKLQNQSKSEFYLRIQTAGALQLPMTLWKPINYFLYDQYRLIASGLFFGILFIMAFYNFLLFIKVRDTAYLYYVGYVSSFYLYQLIATGLGFQLLWPNAVLWNHFSPALILPLNILFVALFFLRVYNISNTHRKTYYLIILNADLAIICIFLPFILSFHSAIICSVALVAFSSVSALWICYYLWYQHRSRSNFYLAGAFTVFLCGASVLALNKLGIIPRSIFTEYAANIGACIEAVLLSYALAERLHEARIVAELETSKVNDNLLMVERQHSATLEEKVSQRTIELEGALKQVSTLNESLQELTFTDQLTGVRNRRFMDAFLDREIEISRRNSTSLSLMIIDVDHFKQINDTYGHATGDECLIQICKTILANIRQPADELCRFGGEEFVVILPNTPVDGAMLAAEKLRSCLESLEIKVATETIRITASFGTTCLEPDQSLSSSRLLEIADSALYQAKADGRNRVIYLKAG